MEVLYCLAAAFGAFGCSSSNDVESCPDGTIPVKGGAVSVQTRGAVDTPVAPESSAGITKGVTSGRPQPAASATH